MKGRREGGGMEREGGGGRRKWRMEGWEGGGVEGREGGGKGREGGGMEGRWRESGGKVEGEWREGGGRVEGRWRGGGKVEGWREGGGMEGREGKVEGWRESGGMEGMEGGGSHTSKLSSLHFSTFPPFFHLPSTPPPSQVSPQSEQANLIGQVYVVV